MCRRLVLMPRWDWMSWRKPDSREISNREPEPTWAGPPQSVEEFRNRLELVGLRPYADDLVSLVRTSARLVPDSAIDVRRTGVSRLGGMPDLAAETPWPLGPQGPLSFVIQVDLGDSGGGGGYGYRVAIEWSPVVLLRC